MSEPGFAKCECRHCGGHIEFPDAAGGQAVPCPHCGQLTELPAKSRGIPHLRLALIVGGVALIAAISIALARSGKHKPPAAPANIIPAVTNPPAAKRKSGEIITNEFSVSAVKLEKTSGSSLVYVTGKVKNLADQQRFGVKVEFGLFDTNKNTVGTATDYQAVLEPKAEWNFKALIMESRAASARFDSISEQK